MTTGRSSDNFVVCLTLWIGAATLSPSPTGAAQSTVTADLQQICSQLTASDNPYFGRGRLASINRQEQLDGTLSPELQLDRVLQRHHLGDLAEAEKALRELIGRDDLTADQRRLTEWRSAVGSLLLAEDLNCHHGAAPSACLVPVDAAAVHRQREPALHATERLTEIARQQPGDPMVVWLLNLANRLAGRPQGELPRPLRLPPFADDAATARDPTRLWSNRAAAVGLGDGHEAIDLAGGAVVDDFDGDGLLDMITSSWDPCAPLQAHRNRGDGTFENVADAWGLSEQLGGLNLVQADADNDGVLDLLVLRGAWLLGDGRIRNSMLRGERSASGFRFRDVTSRWGLAEPARPTQAAGWADIDGDGDLDLYVANEATASDPHPGQLFLNRTVHPGPRADDEPLFLDVASQAGVANLRYAKGVAWGDPDNDGDLDLYVSNFGRNRLYRNDGVPAGAAAGTSPRFVDVAGELGVTRPDVRSFATWWWDFDHDGDQDLFVGDYGASSRDIAATYRSPRLRAGASRPLLYRNLLTETGALAFREVGEELGLLRPSLPMGANFADFDNDGWLDLLLGTGEPELSSILPNQAWRNVEGKGFVDVTFELGLGHLQKGHGVAFGDVDGDGDQDLLHQLGGFYPVDRFANALFENPTRDARADSPADDAAHWLHIDLIGTRANRFGVGSRIEVTVDTPAGERSLHHAVGSGGSFGASTLRTEIGLGDASSVRSVTVRWAGSGTQQTWRSVPIDAHVRLVEGSDQIEVVGRRAFRLAGRE